MSIPDLISQKNGVIVFINPYREKAEAFLKAVRETIKDKEETFLILASKSAILNEIMPTLRGQTDFDIKIVVALGKSKYKIKALEKKTDIFITNQESLEWIEEAGYMPLSSIGIYDGMDFSNHKSKRFKIAYKLSKGRKVCIFTSMPYEKKMDRLWAITYLVDKGERLGDNRYFFMDRFFYSGAFWIDKTVKYKHFPKENALEKILEIISDIYVLAECQHENSVISRIFTSLSVFELSRYRLMEQNLREIFGNHEISASNASVLTGKLLQLSGGAIYDDNKQTVIFHNKKIERLKSFVDENKNKRIVICYWFLHEKTRILEALPGLFSIDTKSDIKIWNESNYRIGLINPALGGDGVLLSNVDALLWFTLTWSNKIFNRMNSRIQATEDNGREIFVLIVTNTIDEKVFSVLTENTNQRIYDVIRGC